MLPFKQSELPLDTRLVLDASNILEVTEFNLFELAYTDWFGHESKTSHIEPVFVNYMFHGEIPTWVRQYARKTIRAHQEHGSIPVAAQLPSSPLRGSIFILVLAFTLGVLFLSANSSTDLLPALQECYFPPCY